MATTSPTGNKKFFIIAVLLVLATFPQDTQEFAFKFGGGGSDDDENESKAIDQISKRPPIRRERKFKFRKIERVYEDADVDDDENASENDNNANNKQNTASNDDEEEKYKFKHARKIEKPRKTASKVASNTEDENSILGAMFSGLFGSSKPATVKKVKSEPSNGIIDWLMWLGERSGRIKEDTTPPPAPPQSSEDESFFSYLNRWPFNALFPFSTKTVNMPRKAKNKANRDLDNEEPMSEAHFEYLLHTLPAFVINASHVSRDLECRQHMQIFQRQLRGKKLWTLQMLDATGKITAGLLRGNINQFGDFDLCTQIKAAVKVTPENQIRIRGKYCLAHIEADTDVPELKPAVHLTHGRGLFNSHLGNPSHFLSRYSVANWGVCIPHICPASVVQEMLQENFHPYNRSGIEFHVEVDDNDCIMRPTKNWFKLLKKDNKFLMTVIYICGHILFVAAALIFDYRNNIAAFFKKYLNSKEETKKSEEKSQEENTTVDKETTAENAENAENATETNVEESAENTNENEAAEEDVLEKSSQPSLKQLLLDVFLTYSPKKTLSSLLSQESNYVDFPVFHIFKLGATLMLYVCLKFMMIGHLPISNRDRLVRFVEHPFSILFRAPIIYADILLLLSGFMVAYKLSEEMAEKRYIQFVKRLATKVTRYLPTIFLVLSFQTWILPQLGTGPLWSNLVGQHAQICEQQMWRNAFNLQNAIDFEDTCSPFTVQLALQVQLFLLGPLIVWLYYTDADAGFFVYGALHALSVATRFSRTNREHLSMTLFHGINVSKFYRSANLLYSSPISRATPYLLGIGFGILYRTQQGTLEFLNQLTALGWILSIVGLLWCFWSPSAGMSTDFIYNSTDSAAYAAWCPLVLGLALGWIIFMFPKNENSLLKFISSVRPILFLSRITFPLQLVTYIVVLHNTAKVRETIKFHVTDLFDVTEIGTILFYATILAFILDVPMQHARHIIIECLFIERHLVEEPDSGVEQSEPDTSEQELSEQQNEKITSDTPEPIDTIWASDPEEEEKVYLNRRRSSAAPAENIVDELTKETEDDVKEKVEDEAEKELEVELEEEKEVEVEAEEEEEEEEEAEAEEEETEVTEKAEIKRSPSPEKNVPRRRRPISNDD